MRFALQNFSILFAALLLIGGCSGKPLIAHAYEGELHSVAELAEIEVRPNVRLMSVDGKRVDALPVDPTLAGDSFAGRKLYLLPGVHRLVAGIAAQIDRRGGSVGVGGGVGGGSGVGIGLGLGMGGGRGRLVPGSSYNDEVEINVEAGKRYVLVNTGEAGSREQNSRLALRDRDAGRKAPELQRLIAREPFDDPYAARGPTTRD